MVPTMFDNDNKNDTKLTDTKSTKLDRKRSKREDQLGLQERFAKDHPDFHQKLGEKVAELSELVKELDAVL
ncbi:MAG: hypothetical protein L7F78_14325 [Syntrophales bacterium LBB04]|nr:hypothetical protein [Syntrophales bacterium LBB04]